MKRFSISELETFSGVKAHTLRIWERRYGLLQPERSTGNVRMYSLVQLKKLLHVAILNRHGYRISEIYKMDETKLINTIKSLNADTASLETALAELTLGMYNGESDMVEQLLNRILKDWSAEILVEKIIYPFLYNTSLLWIGNKLYEEHIVVTAIRQKLLFAIESLQLPANSAESILLFLTDTRQLDLGLLYSHYFFKSRGYKVLYMGNDITPENLKSALQFHSFTYIFTYLRCPSQSNVDQLLSVINLHSPQSKLIIGDYHFPPSPPVLGDNVIKLHFSDALLAI